MSADGATTHIGDIELPVRWGQKFSFEYTPKKSGYRLRLFLKPLKEQQRPVPERVWAECKERADQINTPKKVSIPSNPTRQDSLEKQLYDDNGELTTWGKLSLQRARKTVETKCVDRYRFGHTQFLLADSAPLIEFNVAENGMGSLHTSIRQSRRTITKNQTVMINIYPTQDDNSLITDANPSGAYGVYLQEVKVP